MAATNIATQWWTHSCKSFPWIFILRQFRVSDARASPEIPRIPVPVPFTVRFVLYWLHRFQRAYTILTAPDVILHSMAYCSPSLGICTVRARPTWKPCWFSTHLGTTHNITCGEHTRAILTAADSRTSSPAGVSPLEEFTFGTAQARNEAADKNTTAIWLFRSHIDDYSMTLFWGPGREFYQLRQLGVSDARASPEIPDSKRYSWARRKRCGDWQI